MNKPAPEKSKRSFDLMAHFRKPYGIFGIAMIIGFLGWAVWTFFFSARVMP